MKATTSVLKVPYGKLIDLFTRRTDHLFTLGHPVGKGYVQVFDLERGLQARFWNCSFAEKLELSNDENRTDDRSYFTLAFFLETKGLLFNFAGSALHETRAWNTILMSNASKFKLYLDPMARGHCLSISFSRKWLEDTVLKQSDAYGKLKLCIDEAESFSIHESMTESDHEQTQNLMSVLWRKDLGSFYIKSYVLRLICNFFHRIKDRNICTLSQVSGHAQITEVEKFLNENISRQLPSLKNLARSLSVSESTLLRHFKKKHGINISQYFIKKKMEYARKLVLEGKMTMKEIASLLNYKNLNNFKAMLRKYGFE